MKRMTFTSDDLIDQILAGAKTASVERLGDHDRDVGEYDHALSVGERYAVFDSARKQRCVIRVTEMYLVRWDAIPEKLWRGEVEESADGFRASHLAYFDHPSDAFEFVAYHFELVR